MRYDNSTEQFIVLYNGADISNELLTVNDTATPAADFSVRITRASESSVVVLFTTLGVSVTASVAMGLLVLQQALPEDFQNRTEGLLGNFNGIETDDLIFRNGTAIDSNSSDSMIHEFGQSCESNYKLAITPANIT